VQCPDSLCDVPEFRVNHGLGCFFPSNWDMVPTGEILSVNLSGFPS